MNLYRLFIPLLLSLLIVKNSKSQTNYAARLHSDIVTIKDGKYSSQNYYLIDFGDGTIIQAKLMASSPTTVMSRDNFVSIYSSYGATFLLTAFCELGMGTPNIKELDEIIGEPDLELNFVMARNGLQIQIHAFNERENITMRWSDIFAD